MLNVSRHRPIVCSISIPLIDCTNIPHTFSSHIKWDKLDSKILESFRSELSGMLSSHSFTPDIPFKETLDQTYAHIINSIVFASDKMFAKDEI